MLNILSFQIVLPSCEKHCVGTVGHFKCDGLTENLNIYEFDDPDKLLSFIKGHRDFYTR